MSRDWATLMGIVQRDSNDWAASPGLSQNFFLQSSS